MLYALLEFGTLYFWLAALVPFAFLLFFVNSEKSGWALFTVIAAVAAFVAFGNKGFVPWVKEHPIEILEYVGIYIGAGVVWGIIKWYFYVLGQRDKYAKFRSDYISRYGALTDDKVRKNFQQSAKENDLPPRVENNKGRLIFWMSYWPASGVWTLLNDPLSRLGRFLYNRLGHLFQNISNSMFAKYSDDFK